MNGYASSEYAKSLAEFGTPRALPRCEGWVLERPTPDLPYSDAMGCYPLFSCRDWSRLREDIDNLGDDLVSLSMVPDPFGEYNEAYLHECFRDVVVPFKEHYVIDLKRPRNEVVSKHHRYYARKALRQLSVEEHPEPDQFLDEWMLLHANLVKKHKIMGIKALSRRAFSMQLTTPGITVLRAIHKDRTIAAVLYVLQGNVVHAHVLGCLDIGYELGALYAILWTALDHFGSRARWCNIMGVPGVDDKGSEDIRRFKRGWSKETRIAYFCGRILNRERYTELVQARNGPSGGFFPAYRADF